MTEIYEGVVINFRGGRHTQYNNQLIIKVKGIESRKDAYKLVGKKVRIKISEKVTRIGKVTRAHGNKGKIIARFKKGLPGQVLLKKVEIY